MRVKRQSKARKSLEFFVRAFSFEQPYKFLLDPDFALAIFKANLGLRESLQNLISVKSSKIFITTCIRRELEALSVTPGPRQGEWKLALALIDNSFNGVQYVACKHPKEVKCTAHECIKWSVAPAQLTAELAGPQTTATDKKKKEKKSNPEHFICCAQHSDLRSTLRQIPAVPTLYIHSSSLVFDEPSNATKEYAQRFKVGHHQKLTSRQNMSILSSLQRYAPEANKVLDDVLQNGGVYGVQQAKVPEGSVIGDKPVSLLGAPSAVRGGKPTKVNKNGQVIGQKGKAKAPNPLANKKAQAKQMPSMSYKNQKKLAAATTSTGKSKEAPVAQPKKKQKGNASGDGEKMVQLTKPTQEQKKSVSAAMAKPVAETSAPGKRKKSQGD